MSAWTPAAPGSGLGGLGATPLSGLGVASAFGGLASQFGTPGANLGMSALGSAQQTPMTGNVSALTHSFTPAGAQGLQTPGGNVPGQLFQTPGAPGGLGMLQQQPSGGLFGAAPAPSLGGLSMGMPGGLSSLPSGGVGSLGLPAASSAGGGGLTAGLGGGLMAAPSSLGMGAVGVLGGGLSAPGLSLGGQASGFTSALSLATSVGLGNGGLGQLPQPQSMLGAPQGMSMGAQLGGGMLQQQQTVQGLVRQPTLGMGLISSAPLGMPSLTSQTSTLGGVSLMPQSSGGIGMPAALPGLSAAPSLFGQGAGLQQGLSGMGGLQQPQGGLQGGLTSLGALQAATGIGSLPAQGGIGGGLQAQGSMGGLQGMGLNAFGGQQQSGGLQNTLSFPGNAGGGLTQPASQPLLFQSASTLMAAPSVFPASQPLAGMGVMGIPTATMGMPVTTMGGLSSLQMPALPTAVTQSMLGLPAPTMSSSTSRGVKFTGQAVDGSTLLNIAAAPQFEGLSPEELRWLDMSPAAAQPQAQQTALFPASLPMNTSMNMSMGGSSLGFPAAMSSAFPAQASQGLLQPASMSMPPPASTMPQLLSSMPSSAGMPALPAMPSLFGAGAAAQTVGLSMPLGMPSLSMTSAPMVSMPQFPAMTTLAAPVSASAPLLQLPGLPALAATGAAPTSSALPAMPSLLPTTLLAPASAPMSAAFPTASTLTFSMPAAPAPTQLPTAATSIPLALSLPMSMPTVTISLPTAVPALSMPAMSVPVSAPVTTGTTIAMPAVSSVPAPTPAAVPALGQFAQMKFEDRVKRVQSIPHRAFISNTPVVPIFSSDFNPAATSFTPDYQPFSASMTAPANTPQRWSLLERLTTPTDAASTSALSSTQLALDPPVSLTEWAERAAAAPTKWAASSLMQSPGGVISHRSNTHMVSPYAHSYAEVRSLAASARKTPRSLALHLDPAVEVRDMAARNLARSSQLPGDTSTSWTGTAMQPLFASPSAPAPVARTPMLSPQLPRSPALSASSGMLQRGSSAGSSSGAGSLRMVPSDSSAMSRNTTTLAALQGNIVRREFSQNASLPAPVAAAPPALLPSGSLALGSTTSLASLDRSSSLARSVSSGLPRSSTSSLGRRTSALVASSMSSSGLARAGSDAKHARMSAAETAPIVTQLLASLADGPSSDVSFTQPLYNASVDVDAPANPDTLTVLVRWPGVQSLIWVCVGAHALVADLLIATVNTLLMHVRAELLAQLHSRASSDGRMDTSDDVDVPSSVNAALETANMQVVIHGCIYPPRTPLTATQLEHHGIVLLHRAAPRPSVKPSQVGRRASATRRASSTRPARGSLAQQVTLARRHARMGASNMGAPSGGMAQLQDDDDAMEAGVDDPDAPPPPAAAHLRPSLGFLDEQGYETVPPMYELEQYSEAELATVESFAILRPGFGAIEWPGDTDVRQLQLQNVVVIDDNFVAVYRDAVGDDDSSPASITALRPQEGVELNKLARVTLFNVFSELPPGAESAEQFEMRLVQRAADFGGRHLAYVDSATTADVARGLSDVLGSWVREAAWGAADAPVAGLWAFELPHF